MHGAGNDFIMIDNRSKSLKPLEKAQIEKLCDRNMGIGSDGLLVLENNSDPKINAPYEMNYYNSDGGMADMCGNGARCFARFIDYLSGEKKEDLAFNTQVGIVKAKFVGENKELVEINLTDPSQTTLEINIEIDGKKIEVHSMNTGVPHAVLIVKDLQDIDLNYLGNKIRFHPYFAPNGTNVNFMQVGADDDATISIRTYERGVEGETLACGTGMVANAIIHYLLTKTPPPISVNVRSGETLLVDFKEFEPNKFKDVTLTGSAKIVFEGSIKVA